MPCYDFRDDVHIVSTGGAVLETAWYVVSTGGWGIRMFATWLHGGLLIFAA